MNLPDLQVNAATIIAIQVIGLIALSVALYRVRREHNKVIQEYKLRHRQTRILSGMYYNYLLLVYAYHLLPLYNQRVSAGVAESVIYDEVMQTLMRISNKLYRATLNNVKDPYVTALEEWDEETHWITRQVMDNLKLLRQTHIEL